MIPFDVVYYKPENLEEAVEAHGRALAENTGVRFLSGGTELVTMARDNRLSTPAFVDLKAVPECRGIAVVDGELVVGACATLNEVIQHDAWDLLSQACRGIADHTVRNTLTVGGNAAGMLPYREALLPFLAGRGSVTIGGEHGTRRVPVREIFNKRLRLQDGEFLVDLRVSESTCNNASYYRRHTKDSRVDYPVVSLSMVKDDAGFHAAFAGVASYPIVDDELDATLSSAESAEARAERAVTELADRIRGDMRGSAEYRRFLLRDALQAGLSKLS